MASTADRSGNVKFGATAPFILFNNGVQRKTECQRVLPYDLHLHIQLVILVSPSPKILRISVNRLI